MTAESSAASSRKGRPGLDGVRMAVLSNRYEGIVRAMMNTLFRTGRSVVLNTSRDFSACIVTGDHRFLAAAESIPAHVMRGPDMMAEHMTELHPELKRGDAFLHNSPYHGCSHAGDHSILIPVIDDEGIHRFTVVSKAHQADIGNALPTTYAASARDVYEEGALIFPCTKVQEDYEDIDDIIRMCMLRIRVPEQWWGDYLALLGAARVGERRMLELGAEVGWDTLEAYTEEWFDYSEQRMIEAIRQLPNTRFTAHTKHDPFPGVPDGIPLNVTVEIDAEDARIEVDLRENVDCQPCGMNLSEACARTAAMIGIFNAIDHGVPANAGAYRRVTVHLRENCVVGIPRHPASCSLATSGLSDRVANAVQRGLAELRDGIGLAEVGLTIPPCCGVISGFDPRHDGAPYVNQLVLPTLTGGAGGPAADGWLTAGLCATAGTMLRDSIEIDELRHPIRVVDQRIIPDSEGAGRFRGAPGGLSEFGPVGSTMDVMYASDANISPALGAVGGTPGGLADQHKRTRDGELVKLDPVGRCTLEEGETIVSIACGGGGYGPPVERDPERVRHDVLEGWVSRERAADVYGVMLDDGGAVDRAATERRRAELTTGDDPDA
jgi:N-methylhydantoinase B